MRAFISGAGNWLNSPAGADHLIVKCITRTTPSRLMSFGYADRAILPIIKINEDYIINNHVFTAPARSAGRLHSLLANVLRLLANVVRLLLRLRIGAHKKSVVASKTVESVEPSSNWRGRHRTRETLGVSRSHNPGLLRS